MVPDVKNGQEPPGAAGTRAFVLGRALPPGGLGTWATGRIASGHLAARGVEQGGGCLEEDTSALHQVQVPLLRP